MKRDDLEREFASRAVHLAGMDLLSTDDALLFVDRAAIEAIPVLGVDGISLSNGKTESVVENIADFSSAATAGRGAWDDAKAFIQARRSQDLLFDVVLGDSPAV